MMNKKKIFVIMPFVKTDTRNEEDLTEFFHVNIKEPIENDQRLEGRLVVERSSDRFDITENIIRSVYSADYVICDLSGTMSNPNVMFELGVRFSISDRPVILIREKHQNNRKIFDIQGFYTHEYDIKRYKSLEEFLKKKIWDYENESEDFRSPILKALDYDPVLVKTMSKRKLMRIAKSLELQVGFLLRNAGWRINDFIGEFGVNQPIYTEQELHDKILKNYDEIKKLDWTKFKYSSPKLPSLSILITDLPLEFHVSRKIEGILNSYFMNFYITWLSSDHAWMPAQFVVTFWYLLESMRLRQMSSALLGLLMYGEDPKLREDAEKCIIGNWERSNLKMEQAIEILLKGRRDA